jgi:hypothetical protein
MCDQHNTGQIFWAGYVLSPIGTRDIPMSEIRTPVAANMAFEAFDRAVTTRWLHLTLAEKQRINKSAQVPAIIRVIDSTAPYPACQ